MTLSACLHVVQEAVCRTSSCADAMMKVTGLSEESFLRFEASEAVGGQRADARTAGGMTVVAGAVMGVQSLPTGFNTLALVEEQPGWTEGALGYRWTPAGGARAVASSASAVAVRVMLSRTLGDTLPMMQGGPRRAAHTLGVVGETGGAGRITGVTDAILDVETSAAIGDANSVFEQSGLVRTGNTVLVGRSTAV